MKKLFTLLLLTILPVFAMAEGGSPVVIDGISYKFAENVLEAEVVSNESSKYTGDVIIPSSVLYEGKEYVVTSIGKLAFSGCSALLSLKIPSSVKNIEYGICSGCDALTSLIVDDANSVYDSRNDCNAIIETSSNTLISGCKTTNIPYSVKNIGELSFSSLKELKTISIPNSVVFIGSAAFSDSGLTSIEIPNSVTFLQDGVFSNCSSLNSVKLPDFLESIDHRAFCNCIALKTLEIPNSVRYIGGYAFEGCKVLESLNLPNSLERIGDFTFYFCHSLSKITIPAKVTSIGRNAFNHCIKLETVNIPKSVSNIGDDAFGGCQMLTDVYCFAEDVPKTENHPFYIPLIDNNTTLHVPAASIEKYKSANEWSRFGTITALTDSELATYETTDETMPEYTPSQGISGFYLTQPDSYRTSGGTSTSYGKSYDIQIIDNGDGTFYVDDLFGGWYTQRAGYGKKYAMTGTIRIAEDGTISLVESHVIGWGNSLKDLTGSYDSATSTFKIQIEYLDGLSFYETWVRDLEAFQKDGLNYKICRNHAVSLIKGDYVGDITIPNQVSFNGVNYQVVSIDGAFDSCPNLTSVIIPNSVTSLDRAFNDCSSLVSVTIPNSVLSIYGFKNCPKLASISIPNNVMTIGDGAFEDCDNLQSITIPNSVTSIGQMAFFDCNGLKELSLSDNLTTIGESAFVACYSLKKIAIPKSVLKIGQRAFTECKGLESITVDIENKKYDSRSDCNAIIEKYTNKLIVGCKNTSIPHDVNTICEDAFAYCEGLKAIELPMSITSIESGAFYECAGLSSVKCFASTPPELNENAFSNYNITLFVPENSIAAFKADANWSKFKEIVGITSEPSQVIEVVTPEGEAIKTEITISVVDEDTKTAVITAVNVPSSETGSTKIAIPSNVSGYTITAIEANALAGMTGVTDIYFPDTDQPISLGANALKIDDEHVATVHVPVGLLGFYALNEQLAQNFTAGKVKATVTAPNRYWTFSSGVDVVVPEGVGVYICKLISSEEVKITPLDDSQLSVGGKQIIKANNGVLIACIGGTGGDAYDIVANPGGQSSMAPASYDAKSYGDDNVLEPVIVSKNYPANNYYVLKDGEFHKIVDNSSKMPAGKAVLRIPDGLSATRSLVIVGGDDDATGIRSRYIQQELKWFNLQGRRIEQPTKAGVYIKNGKKVVIK